MGHHPVQAFYLEPNPYPKPNLDPNLSRTLNPTVNPNPGLLKILKKYDKRMLTNLQSSFIRTVSGQPFIATDILTKLSAQCEKILEMVLPPPLHPGSEGQASADAAPGDRLGMGMGVGIRAGGEGGAALDGEGGRKKLRVGRDTEVNTTPLLNSHHC